ncbi:MAG: hypothetical protein K6E10_03900 [Eubacterium sp.]|nr:hypothetical protein [Eubacterium sp.]
MPDREKSLLKNKKRQTKYRKSRELFARQAQKQEEKVEKAKLYKDSPVENYQKDSPREKCGKFANLTKMKG